MLRRLRAAAGEVVGLFVGDWASTLATVAVIPAGWALERAIPGAVAGFAMAGALAALLVGQAALETVRARRRHARGVSAR